MAKKQEEAPTPAHEPEKFENKPSNLDSLTHRELETLYKESTETIRFAKKLQWWTLGSTLLAFGGMIGITKLVKADQAFGDMMSLLNILLAIAVIFALVTYQMWQHTETRKIEVVARNYSTLFARIRRIKSKREANVQRYIMLILLILAVILGAIVTHMGISLIAK